MPFAPSRLEKIATTDSRLRPLLQHDSDIPWSFLPQGRAAAIAHYQQQLDPSVSWLALSHQDTLLATLSCSTATWDSEQTGLSMGRIDNFHAHPEATPAQLRLLLQRALTSLHEEGCTYTFLRIEGRSLKAQVLQHMGFQLIDGLLTLGLRLKAQPSSLQQGLLLDEAQPDDHPTLLEMAQQAFQIGRYHDDPLIPNDRADQVYRTWMQNSLNHQIADAVLVTRDQGGSGAVTGFVTLRHRPHMAPLCGPQGAAEIGLIAVAPEARGQGVGQKLCHAAQQWCRARQISWLFVATQLWNTAAVRTYQRTGFVHLHTQITLRYSTTMSLNSDQ